MFGGLDVRNPAQDLGARGGRRIRHSGADMNPRGVVLVTGAGSGIGQRLAARMLDDGWHVWAAALSVDELAPLDTSASRGRLYRLSLDIRDPDAWERALDAVCSGSGRLDVLMNVAGVLRPGFCWEGAAADVEAHMAVNATGTIHGIRAAARRMVAQRSGHIITVASLAGIAPIPGISLYSASKFAVRGYSLAAAQELRPHGVWATVVCPDAVQSPMLDLQVDWDQASMTFSGGRTLSADEVCDAILTTGLARRPIEIRLPVSRGLLARVGGFLPGLSAALTPWLMRKGSARRKRLAGR